MTPDQGPAAPRPRTAGAHFEMYLTRGGTELRWRLLAANNRAAGVSAAGFADVGGCRAALDHLLAHLDELRHLHTLTADQRWEWTLVLGDDALARSAHSFDRRLRCATACEWFVRTAPRAPVRAVLRAAPRRR